MSMNQLFHPGRAFVVAVTIAASIGGGCAFQHYQDEMPNGNRVMVNNQPWPGVGHTARAGGPSDKNAFGKAWEAAGSKWTTALCQADSDGDGQSNGLELGDPNCTWSKNGVPPSRTCDISHPGLASSMNGGAEGTGCATSQVIYRGYLVDLYCYGLNGAGGLALDGTNVIEDPSQHTLHCLRDPQDCRNGYYLAGKNSESGEYGIMFQLDATGNTAALALLDQIPKSRPDRVAGRFTVTATGTTNGDGILRNLSLVECLPPGSPNCDTVCNSTGNGCSFGLQDVAVALSPRLLLWLHVICMSVSWGCLLPLGVLWARNLRWSDRKLCATPIWFQGHRTLQMVGWLFQLLGFVFIFLAKGSFGSKSHFKAPHEIIGLIVVIIGTLQPLNALLRHLPCIGHFHEDGSRTMGRKIWEILHKGPGYIAVLLGSVNVVLGIFYAMKIGFSGSLVPLAVVFAIMSLGGQLCFGVVAEVRRFLQKARLLAGDTSDKKSDEGPSKNTENDEEVPPESL